MLDSYITHNARTQLTSNTEQSEAPQRIDWSTAVTCSAYDRQPLAFAELAQFTAQQANHLIGSAGYRLINRECQVAHGYRFTT